MSTNFRNLSIYSVHKNHVLQQTLHHKDDIEMAVSRYDVAFRFLSKLIIKINRVNFSIDIHH